jgi:hypothetical protein
MARQGKTPPARQPRPALDDSMLIRSAESLGRMIGTLQRQLDGASKKLTGAGVLGAWSVDGNSDGASKQSANAESAKRPRARKTAPRASKSGATKVQSTVDRTSKRAAKAAVAKKSAGRSKTGSRKTTKSSR